MMRTLNAVSLGCLLCLVIIVHSPVHAQTQYVRGVPPRGHSEYDNSGNWYLVDTCNIDVTITFTNSGNGAAWGQSHVGAGQRQLTETLGNANPRDNGPYRSSPARALPRRLLLMVGPSVTTIAANIHVSKN